MTKTEKHINLTGWCGAMAVYQMENTDLSKILKDKRPVIISCGVPALAYKEDIEQRYYHYVNGGIILETITEYDSKIWYKVSLENDVQPAWSKMSLLNIPFYYIASLVSTIN